MGFFSFFKHIFGRTASSFNLPEDDRPASLKTTDWASLDPGVVDIILNKLVPLSDYIRFSAICKSWYSVAKLQEQQRLNACNKQQQLPLLLIPTEGFCQLDQCGLYSVTGRKVLDLNLQVPNKRLCGSSRGWVSYLENDWSLVLFNPFTGDVITLPRSGLFHEAEEDVYNPLRFYYRVGKVILSADPSVSPNDYMVVVIVNSYKSLAYMKSGDVCWKHMGWKNMRPILISDVIFYDNCILAVGWEGQVVFVDLRGDIDFLELQLVLPQNYSSGFKDWYIVESSKRSLYLIQRLSPKYNRSKFMTAKMRAFRVLMHVDGWKVVEMKDMEGHAVFLGSNESMSILASDYPRCHPNSIYYTEYHVATNTCSSFAPYDVGFFNLEGENFCLLHHINKDEHLQTAVWIVPKLQRMP